MDIKMKKYQYVSFWRAAACIGVFATHLGQRMQLEGSIKVITDFGSNGVLVFFILTGFLAADSRVIRDNKILYWKKRAVKILPLYIAILFFYFGIQLVQTRDLRTAIQYVMMDNVGGTWTLHTFILFYLIMPFIVNIVNSYKRAWIFCFVTFMLRAVLILFDWGSVLSPFRHLYFCAMGVVLWHAIKEKKECSMIFAALAIVILWLIQRSGDYYLIYSLLFMPMIFCTQSISVKHGVIEKTVNLIDKYSYEIYLLQGVVCYLFVDGKQLGKMAVLVSMILGTVVTVLAAYWIIEKPFERILQRRERMKE